MLETIRKLCGILFGVLLGFIFTILLVSDRIENMPTCKARPIYAEFTNDEI